ncbi:hypothetical protein TNCV_2501811 [Trichonephila clavipes]|nr:hypothetical protein TNCV_2501811 [Trichonephila clavipes]
MYTVHRSILSIDHGVWTLSEDRRGKRCAFNIAAFRIGETSFYSRHDGRTHGLFWKNTMSNLGIVLTLYIKLEKYCWEVFGIMNLRYSMTLMIGVQKSIQNAISDGSRTFEQRSSGKDNTRDGTVLQTSTSRQRENLQQRQI